MMTFGRARMIASVANRTGAGKPIMSGARVFGMIIFIYMVLDAIGVL